MVIQSALVYFVDTPNRKRRSSKLDFQWGQQAKDAGIESRRDQPLGSAQYVAIILTTLVRLRERQPWYRTTPRSL